MKKIMYALLDAAKYAALNDRISDAMGFDIGKPTERYAPIEPMMAKVNVQFSQDGETVVETYETIPVMQITGFVQENYPDTLIGVELVDSYVPYTENVQL